MLKLSLIRSWHGQFVQFCGPGENGNFIFLLFFKSLQYNIFPTSLVSGQKRNNNINFCKTILFLYFQKSSPPHSLEDLLNTIPINDDITTTTARVNVVIRDNIWLQKFADFLQRRKLEDDLTILKFLIMIQVWNLSFYSTV